MTKAWPVVEVFGPTIQGEGVDQGVVCHFVRFGGCDYRCTWCDTPYAVIPAEVRAKAVRMDAAEIGDELDELGPAPWVILSGGNPALHHLEPLVNELHDRNYLVAVETQGSRWRPWMRLVDRLCVSPKPPSSLQQKSTLDNLSSFMELASMAPRAYRGGNWMFIKIVCFNEGDLDWASTIHQLMPGVPLYLSAGNDAGRTVGQPDRIDKRSISDVRNDLMDQTLWLIQEVLLRPNLHDAHVQHQLHTAVWGNIQGV